jgi:serine/threonine protein kinase
MSTTSGCPRCNTPITIGARYCANCGADVSRVAGATAVSTVTGPPAKPQRDHLLELLREATLGDYEVLGELGRGGMATVYLAHDLALDRKVAIKVISPALLAGEGMVERFKREARTAASLSHPHIIPIYAVKETDRILYFVMKFVEGRPLDSIIREVGALQIPMVQAILHQAGGALAYAHRRGVVHRDVKPANIMVDEEGWAVVTDFGIAKIPAGQALTMTGVAVGTPAYMSPEQCAAHPVTGASDQYSLAVVIYEMLTGRPPFAADSIMALMYAHFNDPVPPIHELRPDCPPQLESALMRMLAKAPDQRWHTIDEAIIAAGGASLAQDDSTRRSMTELARAGGSTEVLKRYSTPASPFPSVKASSIGMGGTMPLVVSITVTPAATTLRVGQSVQLVATISDARGTVHPGRPVSWASSAPWAATVSPTGLLTAVAPGSAVITATSEGVSGTTAVTTTAPPSRSVATEVLPAAPSRPAAPAIAPRVPGPGRRIPIGVWAGAAAVVLTLGVWALTRGGGNEEPSSTQSGGGVLAALSVTPAADSVGVGERLQLGAMGIDANGASLGDQTVKWSSSQPSVARVSSSGLVTGVAPGVATITASDDTIRAEAAITVRAVVGSLSLTPADTSLRVGESIVLQAGLKDGSGRALPGRPERWTSSNERVATVTPLGLITAVGAGRTTITAEAQGRRASASVAVTAPAPAPGPPAVVAQVSVAPNQVSVLTGETAQLSATLRDARGAPITGRQIRWSSADPTVATVSGTGAVTGTGAGTTRITATSERSRGTAVVTVTAPPPQPAAVASIDVTPDPGSLKVGETRQLRAIPRDAAGTSLPGRPIQWSSSQPGVVSVTNGGFVTAVGAGRATITAASEGERTGVEVTVTAAAAPPNPNANAPAEIAAVLREFAQALTSRRMDRLRSVYPDMSAQQQQGWKDLLESRDVTELSAALADQAAPTVFDTTASASFVVNLTFRTQASGRVTQQVPYLATLIRTPAGWRLKFLQERR